MSMLKDWSRKYVRSKQPRKQRKYIYNAPLHIKRRFLHVLLSQELRKKLNRRNIRIRKGDKVKILRGDFKGQVGEVIRVDTKKTRVYVDTAKRKNPKGEEYYIPISPSNLMILELNLEDKKRIRTK